MRSTRGGKGDNARRTPVSERAYECVCVCESETEGEAVTEALATFLKESVRKRQRSRRSELCSSSASPGSGTERSHSPSGAG